MKTTRNNIIVSPLVNGVKYIIHNVNDEIQQKVKSGHQWNNEIFSLIKSYISTRNLSHFLNIGSHIGTVILPISLHINKVTAVEAYPSTYEHLRQNIKLNNISNIQTFRLALGNSIEDVYFMSKNKICPVENVNRVKNNSGGMHVFTENDIQHNIRSSCLTDKKIKNQMNKLDNIKIDNFDIMLVDIEGSEHDFLLALKLKVGTGKQKKKQIKLKQQVNKYTQCMREIYPDYAVYGLGAYLIPYRKVIYFSPTKEHREISILKHKINELV